MKRPMLWLAGFYMAGLLLGQTLPGWVGFALFAWAAVLFCGGMAKRHRSKLWLVLLLAVALAGGSNLRLSVPPWADWQTVAEAAGTVGLRGRVIDRKRSDSGRPVVTLQVEQAEEMGEEAERPGGGTGTEAQTGAGATEQSLSPARVLLIFPADSELPELGTQWQAQGELYAFDGRRNPGGFDFARYYRNRGIACGMYVAQAEETDAVPRGAALARLRETVNAVYDRALPAEEAGILKAMVTGDKADVDDSVREAYRAAGISHILAISGLHVSLLAELLRRLLRQALGRTRRQAAAITLGFLWAYGLFTGLSASTARAVILATVVLGGQLLYRKADTLNSLGTAALLILLAKPLYLWDAGFLLSFASVAGIVLGFAWLDGVWPRRPAVANLLLTTVFATLGSGPLIAWFYYRVSVVSLAANLLVVPVLELVLALGILVGLVGLWFPAGALFLAGPDYVLLRGITGLSRWVAALPGAEILTGRPPLGAMLFYYGLLLTVLCLWKQKPRGIPLLTVGLAIGLAGSLSWQRLAQVNRVAFLDVGQGDAAVISTYDRKALVIDGGGSAFARRGNSTGVNVVAPYLEYVGAGAIDLLVVTHMDTDHALGALELLDEVPVQALALGRCSDPSDPLFVQLVQTAAQKGVPLYRFETGQALDLAEDLSLTCLYAGENNPGTDTNGDSLVLRLDCGDGAVLFTGDLEARDEAALVDSGADLSCTVLKLSHHGSKYSSTPEFLAAAHPDWAVVSAGRGNRYGHPHAETLERLAEAGVPVLSTARQGGIVFWVSSRARDWPVSTSLPAETTEAAPGRPEGSEP